MLLALRRPGAPNREDRSLTVIDRVSAVPWVLNMVKEYMPQGFDFFRGSDSAILFRYASRQRLRKKKLREYQFNTSMNLMEILLKHRHAKTCGRRKKGEEIAKASRIIHALSDAGTGRVDVRTRPRPPGRRGRRGRRPCRRLGRGRGTFLCRSRE